jgi:tRNA 2-selenouridine synthase
MGLNVITAVEVLQRLGTFDSVIDARSEAEFALDHLPSAVNWPTLNNQERIDIGTIYKQVNPFEAKKRGAAIAARNVAGHIDREVIDKTRDWKPLAYCWRGGNRSGALGLVLGQIGFRVTLIEGGYKAFRAAVVEDITQQVARLNFQVICGTTGSGKTRLLHALAAEGAQVLDLEDLANHRSSVLGAIPGLPQPSQKRFDTLVWDQLRKFSAERVVFVESESKKVGNVVLPLALVDKMRASQCINLTLPNECRVALLMEDYDYLVKDTEYFCDRLDVLAEFRGKAVVQEWKENVMRGDLRPVVEQLLRTHYDPVYMQSMQRNFVHYADALTVSAANHTMPVMAALARTLT